MIRQNRHSIIMVLIQLGKVHIILLAGNEFFCVWFFVGKFVLFLLLICCFLSTVWRIFVGGWKWEEFNTQNFHQKISIEFNVKSFLCEHGQQVKHPKFCKNSLILIKIFKRLFYFYCATWATSHKFSLNNHPYIQCVHQILSINKLSE